jgi:hypothetical protein
MKNKKLTLKDFKVTSFVTSSEAENILGGDATGVKDACNAKKNGTQNWTAPCTNDQGCNHGQTGNTQCNAHGGCIQATNPIACASEACNATEHCATVHCTYICG